MDSKSSTQTNALQSIINRERYRLDLEAHALALDSYEQEAEAYAKAVDDQVTAVEKYHQLSQEYHNQVKNLPADSSISSITEPEMPANFFLCAPTKPTMPIYRPIASGLLKPDSGDAPWLAEQKISAARAGRVANLVRAAKRRIDGAAIPVGKAADNIVRADQKIDRSKRLQDRAKTRVKMAKQVKIDSSQALIIHQQQSLPSFDNMVFAHHFKSGPLDETKTQQ
ncbi:hypothetical protein BKA65DRAFT_559907 [Rhexocercosporidium sp. MPI-PUGE-AT-0058]|nr:hypothetical protein BKA65DRAFT_559907 [Rhexocercosporidium sp. MPI-PUGE-AT-0058]